MVQSEIARRHEINATAVGSSKYASKYPFSGLLICAECGSRLRRHVRTMGTGEKVVSWGCTNRIQNGRSNCDSHHVREDVLQATYKAAIKEITDDADDVIASVKETIESACGNGETERLRESRKQSYRYKRRCSNCIRQSSGWRSTHRTTRQRSKSTASR